MTCTECGEAIHPERLAAIPQAKTCSVTCSADRKRKRRQASSLIAHRKRRERERASSIARVITSLSYLT